MIRPLLPSGAGNSDLYSSPQELSEDPPAQSLAEHPERRWSQPQTFPPAFGVAVPFSFQKYSSLRSWEGQEGLDVF